MKAPIESPLTLEAVTEHFEQWRRNKKKGQRIPEPLWKEAIDLVGRYGVSQVTRVLRFSGRDFNKRRGIVGAGQWRNQDGKTTFFEIDPAMVDRAVGPQTSATAWMELERPAGLRLRIHPSEGNELLALVNRFLGA